MSVSDIGSDNQESRQGNITLYGAGSSLTGLAEKVKANFGPNATEVVNETENGFEIKLIDQSTVKFSVVSSPQIMQQQTMGMANFFARAPLKNEQLKVSFIQQIRMFTSIIGVSFDITDSQERTNVIAGAAHKLAQEITAFVLYPNMRLYHPDGRLLISIEGESEFVEYYPMMCKEMVAPAGVENDNDKARRARSIEILKSKSIPYAERMEVSAYDEKSVIPDKETILHRAISVFGACVKSEVYCSGQYENPMEYTAEMHNKLEELYGFRSYLSNEEKTYIEKTEPDMQEHNKFGWRYECCAVLLWALNLIDMKEPNQICDASELGGIIWTNDFNSLLEKAVLIDRDEILDMQDLVHHYDWACIEAQIKKFELPMLSSEIIYEWHYALNWLTGVDGVTDWDRVPRRA